jgi:phage terminase large subunit
LICRAVGRTVKGSVWIEVQRVIRQWGLDHLFEYRIVDRVITCGNGYQAVFTGLDDVEKLKSIVPDRGVFTDIWIEEATEVDKRSVTLLYKRQRGGDEGVPKRMTMSFNPILQSHWIYKEYFENIGWAEDQAEHKSEDLTILKTTYRDNRFLTEEDREDLEDESDEYYYQVYTLGNWGVLGNVIFHNWEVRDLSGMGNQWTNRRSGLDFGYASDPAALVCTHYDRKKKTMCWPI